MPMDMEAWVAHVETKLEAAGVDAREAKSIAQDLEQKSVRRGGGGGGIETKSWGQQFAEAQEVKDFAAHKRDHTRVGLEIKTTITSAANSGLALSPTYTDTTAINPQQQKRLRDLFSTVPVSTGQVEYPRQTARTLNADMVAETIAKPESALAFDMATVPIRTIAHWIPASLQILEDAPQLAGIIDSELRYGLQLKEDGQLLLGDGQGQNLTGVNTVAVPYAKPAGALVAGETPIDRIALGMMQVMLNLFMPDGIVLNPVDWLNAMLVKDAAGGYIISNPGLGMQTSLWGIPIVPTLAQPVGEFTIGAFKAQTLYDRWQPRVEISTEHADFFTRNMCAIRGEERIGLGIKQPTALVHGKVNPGA